MENEFKDKRILITGGTGSIGSVIARELLKYDPKQIRIYSRDETKQFELTHELNAGAKINFLIGDIRDKERLNMAMENINIVFHAAALKHVSSCESNPFEAVKTNVQGTQNVIDCAFASQVDKVIGISTDKATDPMNVMGCTKALAEKIMLATHFYKGNKKTKFCFVRFGNVLGSRGSVAPLFAKQVQQEKSITITEPNMTRFLMTINDAVGLVLKAAVLMQDREIFILKMPVVTIDDLAKAVIEFEQESNNISKEARIEIIGKKDGERMHEKLLTQEESESALETDDMYIIIPKVKLESLENITSLYPNSRIAKVGEYNSKDSQKLSVEKIKEMLKIIKN